MQRTVSSTLLETPLSASISLVTEGDPENGFETVLRAHGLKVYVLKEHGNDEEAARNGHITLLEKWDRETLISWAIYRYFQVGC